MKRGNGGILARGTFLGLVGLIFKCLEEKGNS